MEENTTIEPAAEQPVAIDPTRLPPDLLRHIGNYISDVIVIFESESPYKILWANSAHYRSTGRPEDSSIGLPWNEVYPMLDNDNVYNAFRSAIRSEQPVVVNGLQIMGLEGAAVYRLPENLSYWDVHLTAIKESDDAVSALIFVGADVTPNQLM